MKQYLSDKVSYLPRCLLDSWRNNWLHNAGVSPGTHRHVREILGHVHMHIVANRMHEEYKERSQDE